MTDPAISHSARTLRLVVIGGIGVIVALYLVGRLGPQAGMLRVEAHGEQYGSLGLRVADLTLPLFILALARLAGMLGAIADGPLFGPRVIRAFRGFAFWLFVAMLIEVLVPPAIALAAAIRTQQPAALLFELRDLLVLAGTLFLFLLARILERAQAIEAELEKII